MKKYCKNVEINADFIETCIYKCFEGKWNRGDVHHYLAKYSKRTEEEIKELVTVRYVEGKGNIHYRYLLSEEIKTIARQLEKEISTRSVVLQDIKYRDRYDTSSHKLRVIGIESIKQQILDYVAVNGLMELFVTKIGDNQFACIPGRGQKFGKMRIENWVKRAPNKCKYVIKADIKKCYPSINTRILKRLLNKYVKNDSLIYLSELLIDTYGQGLSIGSYFSTWLCNFYLSFAYHFACQNLVKRKRKRNGTVEVKRLVFKVAFWMDDIVIFCPRKADAYMALKGLTNFIKNELDLNIKDNWRVYEMGFVDTMGYKIYKDRSTIRSKTFIKIRRTFTKAERSYREKGFLTREQAQRLISFYGKIKETNSEFFKRKYKIDKLITYAKRRVSYESKIFNTPAICGMAGA